MRRLNYVFLAAFLISASATSLCAQSHEGPEDFRIEFTGSVWLTGPTGTIQASGTPINFVSDLAAGAQQPRFYGRFVFKPARKHRIVLEGSPISFSGLNTIDRSFVFLNNTYNISQTVATNANVNYVFGGYQYDPFSGQFGHLGFQAGVAYLGVQGTLDGLQSGITETKSFQSPVPLIGTEFRIFPIPHVHILQVEGMLRGFPAGGYGYFIEGGASAGLHYGPFSLLAGYREMFANLHQNKLDPDGVALHLKGPIFSLQAHW
jgi:hypothetical protein